MFPGASSETHVPVRMDLAHRSLTPDFTNFLCISGEVMICFSYDVCVPLLVCVFFSNSNVQSLLIFLRTYLVAVSHLFRQFVFPLRGPETGG